MVKTLARPIDTRETGAAAPKIADASTVSYGEHIPALDGLRGLALLMVLTYHFCVLAPSRDPFVTACTYWLKPLYCSMDLYFVLSGFLITRNLIQTRSNRSFFKNFYMRRALRIFPVYYFVIFATLLVALFVNPLPVFLAQTKDLGWVLCFALNISLSLDHILTGPFCGALYHYWSMGVEEHFYLLWPLAFFFLPSRKLRWCVVATILLCAGARSLYFLCTRDVVASYVFTFFRLDSLLFGCLAALLLAQNELKMLIANHARTAILVSAVPFVCMAAATNLNRANVLVSSIGYDISALFFSAIVTAITVDMARGVHNRYLCHPILRWLGRRSYAFYLFQFLAIRLVLIDLNASQILERCLHSKPLAFIGSSVLCFAVLCLISECSWRFMEKRILALKSKFV